MRAWRGNLLTLSLAGAVLASTAGAAGAGDVASGRQLARSWCSGCHVVEPEQAQASDAVPTFAQIGKSHDEESLAAFLADPRHSRMLNLALTRAEIADIVAYIEAQAP